MNGGSVMLVCMPLRTLCATPRSCSLLGHQWVLGDACRQLALAASSKNGDLKEASNPPQRRGRELCR